MSQEKVDAYKERKANRKEEIEKAKRKNKLNKFIGRAVAAVIGLGLAFALVLTGINMVKAYKGSLPNYHADKLVINHFVTSLEDMVSGDGNINIVDGDEVEAGENEAEPAKVEAEKKTE